MERDMKLLLAALTASALLAAPAQAAACRDAKGKFIKCAEKAPTKPIRCKDAKGRFAKCGTPGATPAK
jgi:hypothetical protein